MKKLTLLIMAAGIAACSQVETGEVGLKTSFGKVNGNALSPGLYWYMPGISRINILSTRVQTVEQDSQAASKDLQNLQTQLTLNYHLGAQDPVSHFVRLGADQTTIENSIVKPAMSETFKAVVAQFNAEELITKRETVSNYITDTLNKKLKQYDLYVDSISVTNFKFSDAYAQAIEQKQVAEQNANKAKNDLQRINVEAQQTVVKAQAQAQAMQLQKQVATPELIQLKRLEIQSQMISKWNGRLPTYMMGSNNPTSILLNVGE
jgi:prohibitin 2